MLSRCASPNGPDLAKFRANRVYTVSHLRPNRDGAANGRLADPPTHDRLPPSARSAPSTAFQWCLWWPPGLITPRYIIFSQHAEVTRHPFCGLFSALHFL
ncbi:hypothetical protein VUR80DRAFT_5897 [Thermomyces stellatus]